jgi:hypothetical protein
MSGGRLRVTARVLVGLAAMITMLGFVVTACPSNRDGLSGQLAHALTETESVSKS